MFTQDNTTSYTDAQLAELNAELAQRLSGVDEADRATVEKSFYDEVTAR